MSFNHWTLFDAVSNKVPHRPAIQRRDEIISYLELNEKARKFATFLIQNGVKIPAERNSLKTWESGQDHVAIYLHNCKEYMEVTFGANAARAVPFNVNYRYIEDELVYLFNDGAPKVIVYHSTFAPRLENIIDKLHKSPVLVQVKDDSNNPLIKNAYDYDRIINETEAMSSQELAKITGMPSPEDLYLLYTGGTTGMPKGTMWLQSDIYTASLGVFTARLGVAPSSIESIAEASEKTATSVTLPLPPFIHAASQWAAVGTLLAGFTIAIPTITDRLDPQDTWETVEKFKVESMVIVGDAFARPLCKELENRRYDLSSLVIIATGGAATSKEIKERLLALIPSALVIDIGGSSESGAILTNISTNGSQISTGDFYPQPGVYVLDDTKSRILRPGDETIGWLAKGHPIPLGYLGDEEKTNQTFVYVEEMRMSILGDRARILDDGRIELLGRESVTINTGGEKVFAEEVEAVLMSHPSVKDVIVVGRKSERWGNEVVAVVESYANQPFEEDQIISYVSARLAKYKVPKDLIKVDQVLRSPAGKPDYGWARQVAADSLT